ncbi:Oligosaccharyltransferase subunit ost4p [Glarea lozoyensis ATCC 20868]|uniref:Dolichyl-diphosphooligosaccharide--protein glycosyltransferase subunit 4 n=1 Tax=Glarea lozoyensis (strain ATCC 20868 / MF5171) TaxID=1116229 RepID=S3D0W9_GLAL2|nr:Oligosaccharyltransferase subunit ost4p [Glarea lozoyensis ATCC 20868]EPE25676.1 Oligosaccharyltransferase subunit ost4p [Glarea lozoyensis ATCC 20868]
MISDDDLYRLAIVLGSIAMLLIIVYHWLEVNSIEDAEDVKVRNSTQAEVTSGSIGR